MNPSFYIILWANDLCTLQGKHPNFGGHSGALVPVIYLRSRFRNAGDAVADFPGNTEKNIFHI